jgi:hypothetical protein
MFINYDLQLFGEEGGADNAGAAEAPAADNVGGGEPAAPAMDGGENTQDKPEANDKPGTLLGGKEEEAAWDFRGVVPEGMQYDEASASAYSAIAKEAGLTGEQAQKLAAYGMQYAKDGIAAMQKAYEATVSGWAETAKTELGSEFDATVKRAGTGIEALERSVPGLRAALNETGAGNRVELVRAFALIGELVGEDTFRGFGAAGGKSSPLYPNTNFNEY